MIIAEKTLASERPPPEPGTVMLGVQKDSSLPTDAVVVMVRHQPSQRLHRMVIRHGQQVIVEEYASTDCFGAERWLGVADEPRRTQVVSDATAVLAAHTARAAAEAAAAAPSDRSAVMLGAAFGATILGSR